ncbi:uncharacterized protein MONBRDRAFT_7289 [Monosiga brevicollis MX1]|uniref:Arylamine N-acetyltransferase 1 n=1 Tax=Monosiga brevicollis TaxID=81824 RepID=A9UWI1_MONBE|nr:uncharacterized protein MONBRDRAFT_7289 [Monosiga brevicollis MX1]EDQ90049.1 predicted protein [Monosiga brevicollis MX1]CBL43362.1 TPA: arylamine N-acetyltransferase 1 [Monosiga brevicollis]|eukprot:XP_001744816.1 hypothetical protein [Monosiga brevicollis MX1]
MAEQVERFAGLKAVESMGLTADELSFYFAAVGVAKKSAKPSLTQLRQLHRAHILAFPFCNLSCFAGNGGRIDAQALLPRFAMGYGGYCFEHNRLFAAVLTTLGYEFEARDARMWLDDGEHLRKPYVPTRGHMLLLVRVPDAPPKDVYLCDLGFLRQAPLEPLLLQTEEPQRSGRVLTRLDRTVVQAPLSAREEYTLWYQPPSTGMWRRAYSFDRTAAFDWTDVVPINMFVQEHSESIFADHLVLERQINEALHVRLLMLELTETRVVWGPDPNDVKLETRVSTLASPDALRTALARCFNIHLPPNVCALLFDLEHSTSWSQKQRLRQRLRAVWHFPLPSHAA